MGKQFLIILPFFITIMEECVSSQTVIITRKSRVELYISDSTVSFNKKVNGKKEDWWIKNYFHGRIRQVCHYKNGKKDGEIGEVGKSKELVVFYLNGRIKMEAEYRDGKKHGVITRYYKHGGWKMSGEYKDGKKHGIFKYAILPLKYKLKYQKMSHIPTKRREYENGIKKRKSPPLLPSEKM